MSRAERDARYVRIVAAVVCCATWGWFVLTLPAFSNAEADILDEILVVACFLLGMTQIGIGIAVIVQRPRRGQWWGYLGILGAVVLQLSWATDYKFRVRLQLSETALADAVAEVQRQPVGKRNGGSAGLFDFKYIWHAADGAVYFFTGNEFFGRGYGIVYMPKGATPYCAAEHMFGPWYKFHEWS